MHRAIQNSGMSSAAIAQMIESEKGVIITGQTVRNVLHEFSFHWAPAKKCP
jgi:transposase